LIHLPTLFRNWEIAVAPNQTAATTDAMTVTAMAHSLRTFAFRSS
jgi:hypothetical protein